MHVYKRPRYGVFLAKPLHKPRSCGVVRILREDMLGLLPARELFIGIDVTHKSNVVDGSETKRVISVEQQPLVLRGQLDAESR